MVGTAYAELHCHTNFSFLDGASHPEELVEEAHRLGLSGLAVTDHDGLYGVVRFAVAARPLGCPPSSAPSSPSGIGPTARRIGQRAEHPPGEHLVILAEGPAGYAALARTISEAQMRGEKGAPRLSLRAPRRGRGARPGTGSRPPGAARARCPRRSCATVPRPRSARSSSWSPRSGGTGCSWSCGTTATRWTGRATTRSRSSRRATGVEVVATNNVHYATPDRHRLATALAAIRSRRSLDELDGWLPATPFAHLRSPAEQLRRFARYPGAVERTVEIAAACAFDLRVAVPNLPDYPVPDGHTDMSWLRELTRRGAAVYYPSTHEHYAQAMRQIDYELGVIEQLGFPGYFLLLHDIVEFCRTHDIYCQGRGSAANSAVCYALGVTKADAVALGLLFERFLSTERDGPPDIDLDIEHQRREEVIQYVYERYGRDRAAQVANVITYRPRSALARDGEGRGPLTRPRRRDHPLDRPVALAGGRVRRLPRERGRAAGPGAGARARGAGAGLPPPPRHPLRRDGDGRPAAGGVLPDRVGAHGGPLGAPVGQGRLRGRGPGEVRPARARDAHDAAPRGRPGPRARAGRGRSRHDPAGARGLRRCCARPTRSACSRWRAARRWPRCRGCARRTSTTSWWRSRSIRPGPIQGGSVHPYLRRRNGEEEVTYPHPILEPCLRKTLGVPLFQEQLMQMAIDAAGFSPGEADQLRQAMGSKRSKARMARMRDRLMEGMAERGITGETAEEIAKKLEAFASFGFPESHSVRFAYLVYSSSWIKLHHPAEFVCGLLNAQPMGFYSPHTLVRDARRHGVEVLGPCVARSRRDCTLEPRTGAEAARSATRCRGGTRTRRSTRCASGCGTCAACRARCSTASTRSAAGEPFRDLEDFTRRTEAPVDALESLATAGAFACFGVDRRAGLWAAGALRDARPDHLPAHRVGSRRRRCRG